jgi:hypothetical protein
MFDEPASRLLTSNLCLNFDNLEVDLLIISVTEFIDKPELRLLTSKLCLDVENLDFSLLNL